MKVTTHSLQAHKTNKEKFTCLTSYDACTTQLLCKAGIDVILIGDSLGMAIQGHSTTVSVTMDDMIYHTSCVKRGVKEGRTQQPLLLADLPFMTYSNPKQALKNAAKLMQAGAQAVKLEGGAWLSDTINLLNQQGIPVCAHVGLMPQSVHKLGGHKIQGRTAKEAKTILNDAKVLQDAGASLLLVECVPNKLATQITQSISIPVIGIGAGPDTDGQVLVIYDFLGMTLGTVPKFVRNFLQENNDVYSAIKGYINAVKSGTFPGPNHSFE